MMNFAICHLSLVPIRKEPSHRSEQVSQLLFGETVDILASEDNWRQVKAHYDDYTGWVDKKQIVNLTDQNFIEIQSAPHFISCDLVQLAVWNSTQICPLVIGSSLPNYSNHKFRIGGLEYVFEGNVNTIDQPNTEKLFENSYLFLNAPYLWGGRSPFGIDCSGFTQISFKLCGIPLKRDAHQQALQGNQVASLDVSQKGDLAFFENNSGKITHVGILLSQDQIIHCSGRVRIDHIDKEGIFNEETKSYSHNLTLIKRFI